MSVPVGVKAEDYDKAKSIIVSGFEHSQDGDAIKQAMFTKDIPFSQLSKIFNSVSKELGYAVDSKEVTEQIKAGITGREFNFTETYVELYQYAGELVKNIKGATESRIMSLIKIHFGENEKTMPDKPKKRRMGSVSKVVIDVFASNKKATEEDVKNALMTVVKTEVNAQGYAKHYHRMMYAAANNMNSTQISEIFRA
ncbi:MAG: hypothetical protein ABUK08_00155 [Candidatus Humimicrobiaceae bacterium]